MNKEYTNNAQIIKAADLVGRNIRRLLPQYTVEWEPIYCTQLEIIKYILYTIKYNGIIKEEAMSLTELRAIDGNIIEIMAKRMDKDLQNFIKEEEK